MKTRLPALLSKPHAARELDTGKVTFDVQRSAGHLRVIFAVSRRRAAHVPAYLKRTKRAGEGRRRAYCPDYSRAEHGHRSTIPKARLYVVKDALRYVAFKTMVAALAYVFMLVWQAIG